jgi:RNA polymerase sigma-70 factor (ECF subfamily)
MPGANSAVRIEPASDMPVVVSRRPTISVPSFPTLYKTYFDFVWSMTRQLGVNQAELDDVVQEIFIIIHARMHTIERPASLRSWIYGIMRRIVSTYHRTKRTRLIETGTVRVEPEMVCPEWTTPHKLAEQSEQAKLLWSLLEKLDAPKREIFVLSELEEMTAPEIAAAIDVPLNTVYSRLRTARQELDDALRRHHARTRERDRS